VSDRSLRLLARLVAIIRIRYVVASCFGCLLVLVGSWLFIETGMIYRVLSSDLLVEELGDANSLLNEERVLDEIERRVLKGEHDSFSVAAFSQVVSSRLHSDDRLFSAELYNLFLELVRSDPTEGQPAVIGTIIDSVSFEIIAKRRGAAESIEVSIIVSDSPLPYGAYYKWRCCVLSVLDAESNMPLEVDRGGMGNGPHADCFGVFDSRLGASSNVLSQVLLVKQDSSVPRKIDSVNVVYELKIEPGERFREILIDHAGDLLSLGKARVYVKDVSTHQPSIGNGSDVLLFLEALSIRGLNGKRVALSLSRGVVVPEGEILLRRSTEGADPGSQVIARVVGFGDEMAPIDGDFELFRDGEWEYTVCNLADIARDLRPGSYRVLYRMLGANGKIYKTKYWLVITDEGVSVIEQ